MNQSRFHGITSLILMGIAVALGAVSIFRASPWLALGYGILGAIASFGVVFAYCAKCPARENCAHILPGRAARLFRRKEAPYAPWEYAAVAAGLAVILIGPQPFLLRDPPFLAAFWALCTLAVIQIRAKVCRACANENCPLRKTGGHR